jgi:transposase
VGKPWCVDDELCRLIEPVLPPWPERAPGPKPIPNRRCLHGILFVPHTGIGSEDLPQELGFGSGMTCWRRLERWTEAGVFDQVHQILLTKLNVANRIDWTRAAMDGSHIDAKREPEQAHRRSTAASPARSTYLICDGNGTPIYVLTSAANVPDISRALDLLACYPPIAGRPGRPRAPLRGPAGRQGLQQRSLPPSLPRARHRTDHRQT